MKTPAALLTTALLVALPLCAAAQKMQTPAGEAPGPWLLGTIGVGKNADGTVQTTALKGLAIKVGEKGEAAVVYDLDLCRMAGAWTGKFTTPMNLMSRGEYPTAMGEVAFTTGAVPGFSVAAVYDRREGDIATDRRSQTAATTAPWKDPRPEPFGPLPQGQARFRGFYVNGEKTILKWDVGGTEVLEMPAWREGRFVRLIQGAKMPAPIDGAAMEQTQSLAALTKGGPARWPETVTTQGEVSTDTASAYVVDTIKLPDPNPWNAPMFLGGLDFFPDGRAAVCTFHGDVFIVSGIDAKLEKVVWKRFASGLYHALGLKIVKGEIYVTCRDGLWRLNDLNKDGECDFYEAFNHDVMVTKSFHEFVFDLQTDPAGNFYFAKAGPVKNGGRGFDEICAHHGGLLRVSPDGKKLNVVATGFRAPNGIGVGPRGEMTSGDNEGTWTPACKINWIKPGGFYGVVPLAHRDPPPTDYDRPLCWLPKRVDNSGGGQVWVTSDKWGPWKDQLLHLSYGTCSLFGVMREEVKTRMAGAPPPPPPTGGTALEIGMREGFINYDQSVHQGGVVKFPLQFQSGTLRARFNPADGQLYIAGLRGWQTTGVKNGALQRVRYTGAPVRMPIGLHATKRGVRVDFTCALDATSASDPQNWNIEVWNYLWSSAYGSPEISTLGDADRPAESGKDGVPQFTNAQLGQKKHDPLTVKSATLSADKKSVFLQIPDLKPVMQMQIKFTIKSADGTELRSEIINTIHALAEGP